MPGTLDGKVALVTGSSRGIGAAIALRLAKDGAKVVVNYSSSRAAGEEIVSLIQNAGGEAVAIQANLAEVAGVKTLFDATIKAFGRLDILVNNAAVMERQPLDEVTPESIDLHLNLNVRGYLLCAQAAARLIPSGGCIVNITSAISRMAYPGAVVYTATKGAIDVMTRVMAVELGPKGIRVNALAPGSTKTDMNGPASGKTAAEAQQEVEMTALRRQGEVEDIANAVAFLCGPDAGWVTGAWLDVSGGIRL